MCEIVGCNLYIKSDFFFFFEFSGSYFQVKTSQNQIVIYWHVCLERQSKQTWEFIYTCTDLHINVLRLELNNPEIQTPQEGMQIKLKITLK